MQQRDAARVLQLLTQHRPTFTTRDLQRALQRHIGNPQAREQFTRDILAHPDAVSLSQEKHGPELRYTTKPVIETEREILRSASQLADRQQHPVSASVRAFVLKRSAFKTMTQEQARAVDHVTAARGLALIDGQAGTGKTYVMRAVREIYEAQGYRVTGLAPTNAVARNMHEDGFTDARTLHSELWALDHGNRQWTSRTVIMLDEAAMIDSRNLARLARYAEAAGAKLILTGDDRQLASIEAGGMFGVLKERFGAAQLTEVYRQQQPDDRRASELMAGGDFEAALASYDRNHDIHWTGSGDEARAALVRQWATDTAARDSQSRFVFAYTNDDVNRLNAELRQVREQHGELGPARRFATKHGAEHFATGDRIQFTGTDKPQGVFNGEVGTVQAITGNRFTVAIDGPRDNLVTFDAAAFRDFRLGYAGTIYKGQGRTIDETYLHHSPHWQAAPSYVALTRHRHKTALFVARDTAADLPELTRQIARVEENRAASHFLTPESVLPAHEPATAPAPAKTLRSAEPLKQQFRQVAKAVITAPAPKPKRRRKRGEDTRGLFKRAMKKILFPVVRSIFDMGDSMKYAPPDELDETQRLIFRQWNAQGGMDMAHHNEAFHYAQSNYLSPRF